MEYDFLSIADSANRLQISNETMKARLLQNRCFGWIYVKDVTAYSEPNDFLPDWSNKFIFCKWRDLGPPTNGDYDTRIRKADAESRRLYNISGWVIFNGVDEVIANGKAVVSDQWIMIPSIEGEEIDIFYLYTSPKGQWKQERWITEADIFVIDSQLKKLSDTEIVQANKMRPDIQEFTDEKVVSPRNIRPQREQNLLRVIAGLMEFTTLPKERNPAAEKLSMLFDAWGWESPGKSTIADTILKPADDMPRLKPRI